MTVIISKYFANEIMIGRTYNIHVIYIYTYNSVHVSTHSKNIKFNDDLIIPEGS